MQHTKMNQKDLEKPPSRCYNCKSKNLEFNLFVTTINNKPNLIDEIRCLGCNSIIFARINLIKEIADINNRVEL